MISFSWHSSIEKRTTKTPTLSLGGLQTALTLVCACATIRRLGWVWRCQCCWCLLSWPQGLAHTVGCLGGRWDTSPTAAHTPHRNPCHKEKDGVIFSTAQCACVHILFSDENKSYMSFVVTKVCLLWVSQQNNFVATNICCHKKNVFATTKVLSWQAYFCCNKRHVLLWQK